MEHEIAYVHTIVVDVDYSKYTCLVNHISSSHTRNWFQNYDSMMTTQDVEDER